MIRRFRDWQLLRQWPEAPLPKELTSEEIILLGNRANNIKLSEKERREARHAYVEAVDSLPAGEKEKTLATVESCLVAKILFLKNTVKNTDNSNEWRSEAAKEFIDTVNLYADPSVRYNHFKQVVDDGNYIQKTSEVGIAFVRQAEEGLIANAELLPPNSLPNIKKAAQNAARDSVLAQKLLAIYVKGVENTVPNLGERCQIFLDQALAAQPRDIGRDSESAYGAAAIDGFFKSVKQMPEHSDESDWERLNLHCVAFNFSKCGTKFRERAVREFYEYLDSSPRISDEVFQSSVVLLEGALRKDRELYGTESDMSRPRKSKALQHLEDYYKGQLPVPAQPKTPPHSGARFSAPVA